MAKTRAASRAAATESQLLNQRVKARKSPKPSASRSAAISQYHKCARRYNCPGEYGRMGGKEGIKKMGAAFQALRQYKRKTKKKKKTRK